MNILLVILSLYIYSTSYVISCFEYSPYTVYSTNSSKHSFLCGKYTEKSTVLWFSISCDLDLFRYVSRNSVLNLSKFNENCQYYQCIIEEKNVILYENTFKVVYLKNEASKSNLLNFKRPMYFRIPIIFTTQLTNTDMFKLKWFLLKDETFYDLIDSEYVSINNQNVAISIFLPNESFGFIPCLVSILSNIIFECGSSSYIHSSQLIDGQKILYSTDNDSIVLHCGHNKGMNVTWYKDGRELQFDDRILYYYFYIIITHYNSAMDSGRYQCVSVEPFQLPYHLSIFLVTFNSTDFDYSRLRIVKTREKSTIVLPCNNNDNNNNINNNIENYYYGQLKRDIPKFILWTFNVFEKLSYASEFRNDSASLDLYIYDASGADRGLYQCRIYSSGKVKIFSYFLQIESQEYKISNNIRVLKKRSAEEIGEITDFKFKAFSNNINLSWSPPLASVKRYIIKWGKMYPGPDQQIIDGKETKFTIPSLRPETQYFINIVAETVNGLTKPVLRPITTKEENKEIMLTIPVNLKLTEVGDNWSKISWESRNNDDMNEITIDKVYQVEYCPIRSQRGHKSYKNTTESILKIEDVKPATTYEFSVRTCLVNSSKCSDWSMVQEFTTFGTKPGDSPQHLTLSTIQVVNTPSENSKSSHSFAVQVSWQPPKEPNGEIKNYLIFLTAEKRLDISSWGERTVSGKTLNTVIDRLDLNRYYYFRILCSNEYGKSPLSPIRIFKTPDENGKNVGPVYLSKDYYDPLEINEELKLSRSVERGNDDLPDIINGGKKQTKSDKLGLAAYKWWIIIGIVVGAALIIILIVLFLVAIKCRHDNNNFDFNSKDTKKLQNSNLKYGIDNNEKVKFVNKGPILTTPDLFRHTKDQNCHSNYLELEERNESPNSFSSNKAFPGLPHNQPFSSQNNYRNIPGHYTPPGLIHQQNIVMTTSQLTNNSNERHFYQVPFLHHVGHNSFNVFANSAPRVNAAASDFNSINVPSPISDFSDFTSSQATVLYDTSTAKSSGGKSSLSGSGSYNNGLGNKSSLTNEPILEAYSTDKNIDMKYNESANNSNSVSKAFSSEELCQEMANLEGLMKDLNNITQKEFEC